MVESAAAARAAEGAASRSSYWVPMVGHAFRVLEAFYEDGIELGLQDLSRRAGVSKTSVLRILYTLSKLGYVDRDPQTGKYQLGFKIMETARRAMAGRNLVQIARPYMQQLHTQFDETVNLAVLRDGLLVYVEILESRRSFRMVTTIGARAPFNATALGKSIAAYLPQTALRQLLATADFTRLTSRSITSRAQFLDVLAKVRKRGYSIDNEETEAGAFCIAAPIFNRQKYPVGAISVSGPTHRMRPEQRAIAQHLRKATAAITRTMEIMGE